MTPPRFEHIGKFQITDLIGEGAMGAVYRAHDPILDRYVAIKVMSQSLAADEQLRDRFLREARAAGSLQHPNIVTIYDLGDIEGHLYIAMEYLEGADLEEIMERGDPLSLPARLDIMLDVLHALAYAHDRGIVHRDIKPANIRVSTDGRARIMDFGIVHLSESQLTRSGEMMGTPNYMAPEQITGAPVTPATDIFAVGAVLYELLTGQRPFPAGTLHAVLYKVTHEDPKPLEQLSPGLPERLNETVRRALEKDPAARFESALEMAEAVSAVRAQVSGGPKPTIRQTPLQTLAPPARLDAQRRRRLAAGGGLLGLAVAVTALVLWAPWEAPGADAGPPTPVVADPVTASAPREADVSPGPARRPTPAPDPPPPAVTAVPEPIQDTSPMAAPDRTEPAADTVVRPVPVAEGDTAAPPAAPPPADTARRDTVPARPVAEVIREILDEYAAAIEAEDPAALRAAYPGVTAEQLEGWESFFAVAREVRVTLDMEGLEVAGEEATATVAGVYDYVNASTGRSAHQPITFTARFRRGPDGWALRQVR